MREKEEEEEDVKRQKEEREEKEKKNAKEKMLAGNQGGESLANSLEPLVLIFNFFPSCFSSLF